MPVLSVIFNKLQIADSARTLSLSAVSSASFHCLGKDPPGMNITHMLDLLDSGYIWVTHANGCRIDFEIFLDGKKDKAHFIKEIIRDFAAYLRDAVLWSQLSLKAEIEHPECGQNDGLQHKFSVILKPATFSNMGSRSGTPILSAPYGIQVPASITCFQLRKIEVFMTYSCRNADLSHHPLLIPRLFDGSKNSFATMASNPDHDELLFRKHEMLHDTKTPPEVHIALPLLTVHSLTNKRKAPDFYPSSQEEIQEMQTNGVGTSTVLDFSCSREMTYRAFQKLLVGGRQEKSQAGVKVSLGRPAMSISKLAPSLFSPGYSDAVSQRARLIPGISHVFSASLLHNAQSPSLRRKLLSLGSILVTPPKTRLMVNLEDEIDNQSDCIGQQTSRTLGRVIEERLWAMTQSSLYRPLVARNVLSPKNVDNEAYFGSTKGMLDISTVRMEEAEHKEGESLSIGDYNLALLEDSFEDLFQDMLDNGEHKALIPMFSNETNGKSIDDDFEDLFKVKTPVGTSESSYARLVESELDLDAEEDGCFKDWESFPKLKSLDPLDECLTKIRSISDIENEDMLF